MKVIFLDIDGVLATSKEFFRNTGKFWEKNPAMAELKVPYPWNEECVEILNDILDKTNAVIVLSSDWKLHWSIDDLKGIFTWNKVKKYPIAVTVRDMFAEPELEKERVYEIMDYVRSMNIENYIVIDDMNLGQFMDDKSKFVRTISGQGLKQTGLKEKIIKKLNNDQ